MNSTGRFEIQNPFEYALYASMAGTYSGLVLPDSGLMVPMGVQAQTATFLPEQAFSLWLLQKRPKIRLDVQPSSREKGPVE